MLHNWVVYSTVQHWDESTCGFGGRLSTVVDIDLCRDVQELRRLAIRALEARIDSAIFQDLLCRGNIPSTPTTKVFVNPLIFIVPLFADVIELREETLKAFD